jgi:hypothetical protein
MGREKDLFDRAAGDAFFSNRGLSGAKQFKAGVEAVVQVLRRRDRRPANGNSKLHGCGVVDQQETAMLVLDCHAVRKQSEDIPQNAQLGIPGESYIVMRRGGLQVVVGAALHDRQGCQSLL